MNSGKNNRHIEEQIEAYRKGLLTDGEIEALWSIIIAEPAYQDYLMNLVNLEQLNSGETDQKTETNPETTSVLGKMLHMSWAKIAVAAFAMFVISLGLLVKSGDNDLLDPILSEIELNTFRSTAIPEDRFDYNLQKAVILAAEENHTEAIAHLNSIETYDLSRQQLVRLELTRGSLYYNADQYEQAVDTFERMLREQEPLHALSLEKVHWYLANAYLKRDNTEEALHHAEVTANIKGAYSRPAKQLISVLSPK